jgi:putative addiction module component (TIGR02574 family)
MASKLEHIKEEALQLMPTERVELLHILIDSLTFAPDIEVEDTWDAELERRIRDIEAGRASGRPIEDVLGIQVTYQ